MATGLHNSIRLFSLIYLEFFFALGTNRTRWCIALLPDLTARWQSRDFSCQHSSSMAQPAPTTKLTFLVHVIEARSHRASTSSSILPWVFYCFTWLRKRSGCRYDVLRLLIARSCNFVLCSKLVS